MSTTTVKTLSYLWQLTDNQRNEFLQAIKLYDHLCSIKSPILYLDNSNFQWILKLDVKAGKTVQAHICLTNADLIDTFCAEYEIIIKLDNVYWCSYKNKSVLNINKKNELSINDFPNAPYLVFNCIMGHGIQSIPSVEINFRVTIKSLDNGNSICPYLQEIPGFEKLLIDPKFSDFIIICSGKQFNVHKNILSSKSEVFSAMFELDMKEKKEGKVIIEDLTPEVFEELLCFMYCGKINNLQEIGMDLLKAADKYAVDGISDVYLKSMCSSINVSNAVQYLSLAVDYRAHDAKSEIINFIVFNLKEIDKSDFDILKDTSAMREILKKSMEIWF